MSTAAVDLGVSAMDGGLSKFKKTPKKTGLDITSQISDNKNKQSVRSLQHIFTLVWTRPSQRLHLVFSPSGSQGPTSSQHSHGGSGHAGKLEGERPVEQDDDDAEHPFKDGRGVLEDKAFLAEEHAT